MTSTDLEVVIKEHDQGWQGPHAQPLLNPNVPTDVANLRASLEVAYQLALLNEQIGGVLNSRIAQLRVMVESGEWPLQVNVQDKQRY